MTRPVLQEWLARIAITLVIAAVLWQLLSGLPYKWRWEVAWNWRTQYLEGLLLTLKLSLGAMGLALVLGTLAALGRSARNIVARHCADLYVEIIRGTPLLVQIFLTWYVVFFAIGEATKNQPAYTVVHRFSQDRIVAGIVILGVFAGAYIAEVIRAGINAVDPGQREAGLAVGMTGTQVMRYIVFPQAFRRILPPLTGELIALIKDSSLLQIIGISELAKKAYELNSVSYKPFEAFLPMAVVYFCLTWPLSLVTRQLERRYGAQ
ncbi:MAG: amino acid ABC transporter permease [bacterium]